MSPLTEGILTSLIANGITSIFCQLLPASASRLREERAITKLLERDPKLSEILQRATNAVAKSGSVVDARQTESLKLFFISPEAEAITRQIYGIFFAPGSRALTESEIREEFRQSVALHLRVSSESLSPLSDALFEALLQGCERALSECIERGILAAHEAKSASRHRMILDELAAVRQQLDYLRDGRHLPSIDEVADFEIQYRKQLAERHGYIIPPHFGAAYKLPIKDICVNPRLTDLSAPDKPVRFEEFVSRLYRVVVLGNPGGGKSTLVGQICFDLASNYRKRLLGNREITPIVVILRDYGTAKKESGFSILKFIERSSSGTYQLNPPPNSLEYLVRSGRAMVIFDGLDELLDTSDRQEICSDIELFCNLYPSIPVLVTSREVGYEQAPLNRDRFRTYRLSSFDEEQVAEYVRKWFSTEPDLSLTHREQKASSFLAESAVVGDLRSNPLMLALMCNIYRGENYIPRNRPDVYEKCSNMLFERWDKGRGIRVSLPIEAHISPALKFLAYWIYSEDKLNAGVTEHELIQKVADYLCRVRFEDRIEAEAAAQIFIDFCKGRAWVFTDTGTTRDGESLYQFTHRTFLEYFAAAHLVRLYATPSHLIPALLPRIAKEEWDMVAQLAFQLQNKQVEGAGDELLEQILAAAADDSESSFNLLSFAARALEFLVPSPAVARRIVDCCFRLAVRVIYDRNKTDRRELAANLIGDCTAAAAENIVPVTKAFEALCTKEIGRVPQDLAESLVPVALLPYWGGQKPKFGLQFEAWRKTATSIARVCRDQIRAFSQSSKGLAVLAHDLGQVTIADIISWHGPGTLRACNLPYLCERWTIGTRDRSYGKRAQQPRTLYHVEFTGLHIGSQGSRTTSSFVPNTMDRKSICLGILGAGRAGGFQKRGSDRRRRIVWVVPYCGCDVGSDREIRARESASRQNEPVFVSPLTPSSPVSFGPYR